MIYQMIVWLTAVFMCGLVAGRWPWVYTSSAGWVWGKVRARFS